VFSFTFVSWNGTGLLLASWDGIKPLSQPWPIVARIEAELILKFSPHILILARVLTSLLCLYHAIAFIVSKAKQIMSYEKDFVLGSDDHHNS
jgi:hypothetical protein